MVSKYRRRIRLRLEITRARYYRNSSVKNFDYDVRFANLTTFAGSKLISYFRFEFFLF